MQDFVWHAFAVIIQPAARCAQESFTKTLIVEKNKQALFMMMMMIFQVEFIDKPFVLWHSPESCRLEEKSHEPCLGEMFETRCWPKNPLVLWPTLTEAVAEEQEEDSTMVIERNRFCAERQTLIRRSLNTWTLSLSFSVSLSSNRWNP